jgi:SnoaL-like domain
MIAQSPLSFGVRPRNSLCEANKPGLDGALAALETFYYALNNEDIQTVRAIWADHPLAQIDNPIGGILRSGSAIVDLYAQIFTGPAHLQIEFSDFVQYGDESHVVFAGRETGTYHVRSAEPQPVPIRTTRYVRYESKDGHWRQYHHHGSVDEPEKLAAYQNALLGTKR